MARKGQRRKGDMSMTCIRKKGGIVCVARTFKPGDPAPKGYLDHFEWHEVQQKAGLRQVQCGSCGKYCYPQQLSNKKIKIRFSETKHGPVLTKMEPMCKKCNAVKEI